jgi:hypothetical protein
MTRLGSCGPPRWSYRACPPCFDKDTETLTNIRQALTLCIGPLCQHPPRHSILSTAIVPPLLRRQLRPWSLRQLFLSTRILLVSNLYMFYICAYPLLSHCSHITTRCHSALCLYSPSDIIPESTRTSYTRLSRRAQNLCKHCESWARQI